MNINDIYLGDSLEIISSFPKNSVDCIITDPPYNIAKNQSVIKLGDKYMNTKSLWGEDFKDDYTQDEYMLFMSKLSELFFDVLKDGGSLLIFIDRGSPYYLLPFYNKLKIKNSIIFEKLNVAPHIRKCNYRSSYEQCYWFSKGKTNTFNFLDQKVMKNIFRGNIGNKKTEHPTEKYEWMISPLVERHTDIGDIILDPFFGSGTTGIAALKYNRKFIGIEKNKEFYEMSKSRIEEYTSQMRMF